MCLFCKCPPHPFTPHHRLRWFFFLYISQLLYIYPKPLATTFCTFRALLYKSWEGKKTTKPANPDRFWFTGEKLQPTLTNCHHTAATLSFPFLQAKLLSSESAASATDYWARVVCPLCTHCIHSLPPLFTTTFAKCQCHCVCLPASVCVFPPLFATIYLHRPILVPLLSSFLAPARKPP